MALAKYFEEIEERWLEGTSARYESRVTELFEQFPPPPPSAGEVHLTRAGRSMEDIEVCEVGQVIDLEVVSTPGAAEPIVELAEKSVQKTLPSRPDNKIQLKFTTAGVKQLRASSAGYLKIYTIHAVEPVRVEELPDFARLIRSLSDNPPKWTSETFDVFRSDLESTLRKQDVPQYFIEGIVEYHLGLFHEEQGHAAFRERLQGAYGRLRWFIPYSDIARLVCTHYFYCANEFEAALRLCGTRPGRLRRTLQFFQGKIDDESVRKPELLPKEGLPLLVSLSDLLTFQAVDALREGRASDASELCAAIRRELRPAFHKERAARLQYLEACTRKLLGEML